MTNFYGFRRPKGYPLRRALCKLYGVSTPTAERILAQVGLAAHFPVEHLSVAHKLALTTERKTVMTGERLKIHEKQIFQKGLLSGAARFVRQRLGYPAHGQRTSSNARTARRLNGSRFYT